MRENPYVSDLPYIVKVASNGMEYRYYPKPEDFVPEKRFPEDWRNEARRGKRRCLAWSKQRGHQCTGLPMRGRDYCYHHGGVALRGNASPNRKGNIYSDFLPSKIKADYDELLNASDLFDLRNTVALLSARARQVFDEIEQVDYAAIEGVYADLLKTYAEEDWQAMGTVLSELKTAIEGSQAEARAWKELREIEQERLRVIESDRRTKLQAEKLYTLQEIGLMMGQISSFVSQIVYKQVDTQLARKIIEETNRKFEDMFEGR